MSELHKAATKGDVSEIKRLVASGADVNSSAAKFGRTPLLHAIIHTQIDAVRELIKGGANVNIADEVGQTPLLMAVQYNNMELVQLLLDAGADVNATTVNGQTTLMRASLSANPALFRILLEKGVDVNAKTDKGLTALHQAANAYIPKPEIVEMLLGANADPNAKTTDTGATPLMNAAENGHIEVVRMLLSAGADPSATNNEGQTAVQLAEAEHQVEVVSILQDAAKPREQRGGRKTLRRKRSKKTRRNGN
jgi:ankyrin repeat protein